MEGRARIKVFRIWNLILVFLLMGNSVFAQHFGKFKPNSEPQGFRGIEWGAGLDKFDNLKLHGKYKNYEEYIKEDEDLDFEGIKATRIIYAFIDGKFKFIVIGFEPKDETKYELLKAILVSKYGEVETQWPKNRKDISWEGTKTHISLITDHYKDKLEVCLSSYSAGLEMWDIQGKFQLEVFDDIEKILANNEFNIAKEKIEKMVIERGNGLVEGCGVWGHGDGADISLFYRGGYMGGIVARDFRTPSSIEERYK